MLRVLRSKTLSINSVADLNENSCGKLPTFFSIYLLTFKTVSTVPTTPLLYQGLKAWIVADVVKI